MASTHAGTASHASRGSGRRKNAIHAAVAPAVIHRFGNMVEAPFIDPVPGCTPRGGRGAGVSDGVMTSL
ncbi:hypothetical protein GCM10011490_22100 [Pseudoclavibacter endophyticus]|nr:hypothetical protein GCM10011490_22100 [Pseudoclavibacter endophyticus]